MRLLTLLLIGQIFGSACSHQAMPSKSVPEGILSPGEMQNLLVEFALAESITNLNSLSIAPIRFDTVYHFNPLLANGIRASQYDSSILYYSSQPVLYRELYDSVLVKLNAYRISRETVKSQVAPAE